MCDQGIRPKGAWQSLVWAAGPHASCSPCRWVLADEYDAAAEARAGQQCCLPRASMLSRGACPVLSR